MYKLRVLLVAVVAACAVAFVPPVPPVRQATKVRRESRRRKGGREERPFSGTGMKLTLNLSLSPSLQLYAAPNLLTQADLCLNGECSVEDVSGAYVSGWPPISPDVPPLSALPTSLHSTRPTTELLTQIRVKVKDLKEQTTALQQLEAELTGKNMPGQDVVRD